MKCVHNILFTDFMIYEKLINDIHLYTILSYAQKISFRILLSHVCEATIISFQHYSLKSY